jgi:hypothetical protein
LMNNAAATGTLENELLWREVQRKHKRGRTIRVLVHPAKVVPLPFAKHPYGL